MTAAKTPGTAMVLASILALSTAPRPATADVLVTAQSVQAAIVAAVEKERKVYGGETPVPGVLVGVWDGSGGSYVHPFGDANMATHRPMTAAFPYRQQHQDLRHQRPSSINR